MKKKRIIFSLLYLLLPALTVFLNIIINHYLHSGFLVIIPFVITVIISILSTILFSKFKPCGYLMFILGFVIPPIIVFIYSLTIEETGMFFGDKTMYAFAYSYVFALFYLLPCMITSFTIFIRKTFY